MASDNPIAVWYHCRLSGGDPPIDLDHASGIMSEQMTALKESGLEDAAHYFYLGVNGGPADYTAALCLAPSKAHSVEHCAAARGELPTLHDLQKWLPSHPDWYVCYHHTKGAIHKGDSRYDQWRRNMQEVVITNWKRCVADLDGGVESVGAHWMTPEKFPGLVKAPFWGGNFWWAKASFLLTLPPMPPTARNREEFYYAESWMGLGPRRPQVKDYRPGWPM